MESGKYDREWHDDLSRGPASSKSIPKGDHLLGHNVNHQGEMGQRAQFPSKRYIIKNIFKCNTLKCLKYWNDTHHNTWFVPHGEIPNVFWKPTDVVDTVMMNLELWWRNGSFSTKVNIVGQDISRYSMYAILSGILWRNLKLKDLYSIVNASS